MKKYTPKNRLIIHNDSDLYTSSLFLLTQLDIILYAGSILIFDEFHIAAHEFQAFIDYTTSYYRSYEVLAATNYGSNRYPHIAILLK